MAFRRLLRAMTILLGFVVLASPFVLGPAGGVVLRALGGAYEHRCACGMQAGTCGCSECERLERRAERDAEMLHGQPTLKSSCDAGARLPNGGDFPIAEPPTATVVAEASSIAAPRLPRPAPHSSFARARPSTPPPRSPAVT